MVGLRIEVCAGPAPGANCSKGRRQHRSTKGWPQPGQSSEKYCKQCREQTKRLRSGEFGKENHFNTGGSSGSQCLYDGHAHLRYMAESLGASWQTLLAVGASGG